MFGIPIYQLVFAKEIYAQSVINPALDAALQALTGPQFLSRLLPTLIGFGFVIGVIVFFFVFVIGAIQYISSGGDKGAIEEAKSRLTNAAIGLTILLSFFMISNLIGCFFGINLLTVRVGEFDIGFSGASFCGGGGGSTPPPNATPTPSGGGQTCTWLGACPGGHLVADGCIDPNEAVCTGDNACVCRVSVTRSVCDQQCMNTPNPANCAAEGLVCQGGFFCPPGRICIETFRCRNPICTNDPGCTCSATPAPSQVVIPNNGTGSSCTTVCGARTCVSVGTNATADNGAAYLYWYPDGGGVCADGGADCSTVIPNLGQICVGRAGGWTNCLCQ